MQLQLEVIMPRPGLVRTTLAHGALAAMLTLVAACRGEPPPRDTPSGVADDARGATPGSAGHVALDSLHRGEQSGFEESARHVIRSEGEWRELWQRSHGDATPAPQLPPVDFARAVAIVAAAGQRPSGGYEIRVDSALLSAASLIVHVTETRPGASCMTTAALTSPVEVVRVESTAANVVFREREVIREC